MHFVSLGNRDSVANAQRYVPYYGCLRFYRIFYNETLCLICYYIILFKSPVVTINPTETCRNDRLQSLKEFFSLCFEARFTKQSEHVLLIALNSRLVKRINSKKIAADTACKFEEIEQLSKIEFVLFR